MENELLSGKTRLAVKGAVGSFRSMLASLLYKHLNKSLLICCKDLEEAEHFYADLLVFNESNEVYIWKDSFRRAFDVQHPEMSKIQAKASVLDALTDKDRPLLLVSYPEAIAERIVEASDFEKSKLQFKVGEEVDMDFLMEMLHEYHFEREDFVYDPGQFAWRGGIIDVFSFAGELPVRIELDGREIESIREFDPITQLSTKKLNRTTVVPNVQEQTKEAGSTTIFDYLHKKALLYALDLPLFFSSVEKGYGKLSKLQIDGFDFDKTYISEEELLRLFQSHQVIEGGQQHFFRPSFKQDFEQIPQPLVNKNFTMLIEQLRDYQNKNFISPIFSESVKQIERLESIFDDLEAGVSIQPVYKSLTAGFVDKERKVACLTEHQIFNRYYRVQAGKRVASGSITLKELQSLKPGDYVVHIDHGIGQFQGLQKMEMGGKMQEAVRIKYKNDDLLYVNIGSLHKISKFKGQEGQEPKLNKLGSDSWQNLKTKTKKKVKDIARDLIKLYAKRKKVEGFKFSPDTYLQTELEASFLYEDTPDQAKATDEVKQDMEGKNPMDRLVCGDVGFGKTEVAIRAAFKAVTDSKQVAVLVPTTILAQQHYHTFRDRLMDFPCRVDYINRFRSAKQQKETLKGLEEGKVDIIIGTHKLLGKNIKFRDLGLLIIDEEQKFGVSAKEQLKALRTNVDTLTLTATPIPRTLHFSLMGARDLSIIQTPPANRRPVQTEVHVWNNDIIKEAVEYELERGGQVFVIHNRVKDIQEIAHRVSTLVPGARVAVGHGQMKGDELEQVMVQFIEGEFDVLVATTIIESGLDIPNANTIIINNAHMFGLSDLHQMRGRVGRSNVKAFCYLLAPPLYTLPDDGRRRMQAIEEYADLGAGFNVAMRDLDIRGAGNLLGGEQSGFISEIGFQMYHKILDEAIAELREEEFKGVIGAEQVEQRIECTVEPDVEAHIPDRYVNSISERVSLYTSLSSIDNIELLEDFKEQLIDRFGAVPEEVQMLLRCVEIKLMAEVLKSDKVRMKGGDLLIYLGNNLGETYFQSGLFGRIMAMVNERPDQLAFKQGKDHLIVQIKGKGDLEHSVSILSTLSSIPKMGQKTL